MPLQVTSYVEWPRNIPHDHVTGAVYGLTGPRRVHHPILRRRVSMPQKFVTSEALNSDVRPWRGVWRAGRRRKQGQQRQQARRSDKQAVRDYPEPLL